MLNEEEADEQFHSNSASIQILLPFKFCFHSNSASIQILLPFKFCCLQCHLSLSPNVSQRVTTCHNNLSMRPNNVYIYLHTLIPLLSLTNIECGRLTIRFVCCLYD